MIPYTAATAPPAAAATASPPHSHQCRGRPDGRRTATSTRWLILPAEAPGGSSCRPLTTPLLLLPMLLLLLQPSLPLMPSRASCKLLLAALPLRCSRGAAALLVGEPGLGELGRELALDGCCDNCCDSGCGCSGGCGCSRGSGWTSPKVTLLLLEYERVGSSDALPGNRPSCC